MKLFRRKEKKADAPKVVRIEPEVSEGDIRSFFAKFDERERNVPVAMIAEWKQMTVEKMERVHRENDFAFEQGRLAAYCEMEKLFLEMAEQYRNAVPEAEEGDDGDDA